MPANKAQIIIYNELLGIAQDYKPNYCYVLGRGWKYTKKDECFECSRFNERLGSIDTIDKDKEYTNKIKEGKIALYDNKTFDKYVSELKEGIDIQVDLKKKAKFRSIPQNNLYWLYLSAIEEYTGYSADELHSSFRSMFLTDNTRKPPLVRSTTMLDTNQFGTYLEKIRMYVLENISSDIIFPDTSNIEQYK